MQSIRWGDHSAHLIHSVSDLYRNSVLTDCILDMEGGSIHVHKIIIAACSPHFKKLLKKDLAINLISIKNVSYKDMKLILDLIYYGEADVSTTDVTSLMKTAELLDMTSLKHNLHHCFQEELSCKDKSERSMFDRGSVPCTNRIGHETNNLTEELVPYNPAVLYVGENRLSDNSQHIHVHAISDSSAKYLNNFRNISGELNKVQLHSSVPYRCDSFKKNTKQDDENVNEELLPFTFVAVSEIKEANERHLDDLTCFDSVLKDPLGENSGTIIVTEERNVKKECELQVKKEPKDENDVSESMGDDISISEKLTHSFHELTSKKSNRFKSCDEGSGMDMNPDVILSDTFGSENCVSEKASNLEIKFESICEITGVDEKEKKVFETGECTYHIIGDNRKTVLLEPRNKLLSSGVQHFSNTDNHKEVNEEDCDASEISAFALEIGSKTPALYETLASSSAKTIFGEEKKKLKKKMKESDNSSHNNESLISKKQINLQPLVQRDRLHLPFKPELCVRNDQVWNMHTHSTKVIKFSCKICCKSFRNVCYLRSHMTSHTRQKKLHHKISKNSFYRKAEHGRTYFSTQRFDCPVCNKPLGNKYYLGIHMRTHRGHVLFACEICKKKFSFKAQLNQHMRSHAGDRTCESEMCKKTFSQNGELNRHVRSHTGDRPYECEICKKTFSLEGHLNRHLRTHSGERLYMCEICKKPFSEKYGLSRHLSTHTGERPYECEICKKSFSQKCTLKKHLRLHTGDKPYECELCKKRFSQKCYLNIHLRTHTGYKPHECEICKKTFSYKYLLNIHLRTHSGERPYQCEICLKAFSQKGALKIHMRTHTGFKPHECEICKKAFSVKGHLNKHLRTHTGERPYMCEICKKLFSQKGILKKHLRMHTRDKSYECEICKKTFSRKGNLNKHVLTHAGDKLRDF